MARTPALPVEVVAESPGAGEQAHVFLARQRLPDRAGRDAFGLLSRSPRISIPSAEVLRKKSTDSASARSASAYCSLAVVARKSMVRAGTCGSHQGFGESLRSRSSFTSACTSGPSSPCAA